ncbi:hypothetical protein ACV3QH_07230 [Clostridium perfringens]|uniref:hypothetical protein n=1 Tax=Clostridium perfringens TaxID=1502 RepID=UPI0013E3E048|nr:hypothetical protein [Clostridium perfringens]NGT73926.1 hypothetical protein [Clostridium perfringens]
MGYNYKSFKEIKEIDTISFKKNLDEINSFFKDKKDFFKEDKFDFYFPLENAVLKFKMEEVILYFYFNMNGLMELYIYNPNEYFFEPCVALKFENVVNGEFKFKILENSRGYKIDKIDNFINIFIRLISYINFIKDNKNITIKSNRKKRIKVNNSNKVKYKKRSVEFIEDSKVIYIASISEENFNKFKKYTRHTESWNVMGFVRHYKNGKTVWVRPHTRGNGNKSKKDYIVK